MCGQPDLSSLEPGLSAQNVGLLEVGMRFRQLGSHSLERASTRPLAGNANSTLVGVQEFVRRTNHMFPIVVRPTSCRSRCRSRLRHSHAIAGNMGSLDRPSYPPDDTTRSPALPTLFGSIALS
jgi:hypothetical protein